MKTKLFVSKSLDEQSPLLQFCQQRDWEVIDRSLIYFDAVPFRISKPFDLVFISSIRAFDHFMEGYEGDAAKLKFAVAGKATASQMNVEISQIDYVVENSGDTFSSSSKFRDWVGERHVLFPVSQISNNTYSNALSDSQKESVVCYNTLSYPSEIEPCNFYVFTSPSNVQSFLLKNAVPDFARIISWGKTTKDYLHERGFKPSHTLQTSSEEELVQLLNTF